MKLFPQYNPNTAYDREDRQETPEQAMVRRQSAAAALFIVEKEYQQ